MRMKEPDSINHDMRGGPLDGREMEVVEGVQSLSFLTCGRVMIYKRSGPLAMTFDGYERLPPPLPIGVDT